MRALFWSATLFGAVACSGASSSNGGEGLPAASAGATSAGAVGSSSAGASNAAGGSISAGGAGATAGGTLGVAGSAGSLPQSGGSSGGEALAGTGGATNSDGGVAGTAGALVAGSGGTAGIAGAAGSGGSAGGEPVSWPCPPSGACVILPLGDSITYGYGSTTGGGYRVPLFSKALTDHHSITFVGSVMSGPGTVSGQPFPQGNEGHSGYSIDDSSATKGISPLVDHALATYKPNIVLLMIGTNDMHYDLDLANAPTRLGKLLDQISTDSPNALVVVAKIVPANGAQDTPTQAYNAAIPAVVQARTAQGKHLVLVDMYAALGHWSTTLFKDSEHPNDAGYNLMADTWYSAIHTLLR